jgi:hypothetical protein
MIFFRIFAKEDENSENFIDVGCMGNGASDWIMFAKVDILKQYLKKILLDTKCDQKSKISGENNRLSIFANTFAKIFAKTTAIYANFRQFSLGNLRENENKFTRIWENENFRFSLILRNNI